MDIEKEIEEFLNKKNITPYHHIYNADGNIGWDIEILIEEFAELYAEQKVNDKWISVKDSFPDRKTYGLKDLIVLINGQIKIGTYDECRDFWIFSTVDYAFTKEGVTHWMPLPEIKDN